MDLSDLESKDFIVEVGKTIKKLRNEKKLTLEEFSNKTGISRLTLTKIEKGLTNPTLNIMWKICSELEIELSELFNVTNEISISRASKSIAIEDDKKSFKIELMFKHHQANSMKFFRVYLSKNETILTEKHKKNSVETIVVMKGKIELSVDDKKYILNEFDSMKFRADIKHSYKNLSDDISTIGVTLMY